MAGPGEEYDIRYPKERKQLLLLRCNTKELTKQQLDPIDLAFYKPLLEKHVARCYHRTSVFYGLLVAQHSLYTNM